MTWKGSRPVVGRLFIYYTSPFFILYPRQGATTFLKKGRFTVVENIL